MKHEGVISFLLDPTSLQNIQNAERPKLKLAEFMSEYIVKYFCVRFSRVHILHT